MKTATRGLASSHSVYDYIKSNRGALMQKYGNQLPAEAQLATSLGTDRFSLRRALKKLVEEGYLYSLRNRGYYFELGCDQIPVKSTSSYHAFCAAKHIAPRVEIVELSIDRADASVATGLELEEPEEVWNILFLRYREEIPICLTRSWIPRTRTPGLITHLRRECSLYQTLSRVYGIQATRIKTVCSALNAGSEEARLLDLPLSSALLGAESTAVDQEGIPIEFCRTHFRGDVCRLEFNISGGLA